jgi:hypothetical protein
MAGSCPVAAQSSGRPGRHRLISGWNCNLLGLISNRVGNELHLPGDPTVLGWTTFALYLIASILSFRIASASRLTGSASFRHIWGLIALMLVGLGVNKQLDLQTLIIQLARQVAFIGHLYEYRFALHALFFLGLMFLLAVVLFRWWTKLRLFSRQLPMAATGCAFVLSYIMVRAASIDRVDRLIGFDLEGIPFLWLLEVGGLTMIIAQALGIIMCPKQ